MENKQLISDLKHTPGPWKFGNTSENEFLILGGANGAYVCHVTISQIGGGAIAEFMQEAREANAKLILAVPDLLKGHISDLNLIESLKYDLTTDRDPKETIAALNLWIEHKKLLIEKATKYPL